MKAPLVIVLGTLVAPLPMAGLGFYESVVYSRFDPFTSFEMAMLGYFFTLGVAIMFGLPLFWLASSLKLVRWWTGAIAGALIGFLMTVVMSGGQVMAANDLPNALAGSAGGLLFWFVWRSGKGRHLTVEAT